MTVHEWSELTREQLGALLPEALVVLAVGATEQHGPHLPTGTDALVVEAVVRGAAAAFVSERDLVLAPVLAFGASDHHFPFGGTLSLRVETMTEVLLDLARSVAAAGGRRLLIVNGHGGNRGACHSAVQRAATAHGLLAAYADYWELLLADAPPGPGDPPVPGHAGGFESSLVAHLRPELVRELPDRPAPPPDAGPDPGPDPGLGVTVHEQAAWTRIDGFTDRPADADAEAGRRWFDACVAALATRIERLTS